MSLLFDRTLRQVTVPEADGTRIAVQSVYDAIRVYEATLENMDLRSFANGSGKQSLGGVSQVGITLELIERWHLGFEARLGPATVACAVSGGNLTADHELSGAATSSDGGTTLTDTSASFVLKSVQTGDVVRNVTDGSSAVVTGVTSATVITHTQLSGGSGNDWGIGDEYAVDTTHPLYPTEYVHVTISQDAAPVEVDLTGIAGVVPDAVHVVTAYVESTNTLRLGVWLDRDGSTVTAPTSATVNWYEPDGTLLFSETDSSPDVRGQFSIEIVQALASDTAYYVIASVTDADGSVTTRRGVATAGT